jgi:holo-[acyl-carrier protein] synthase
MPIIGHGIDLIEIDRIERMLSDHGERFTYRCFTESERCYAEAGGRLRAERYAARFACKEAVLKALGTGWAQGTSWQDVEVRRDPAGRPTIALTGRCAEIAANLGIRRWHVSISHSRTHAMASVIGVARLSEP